MSETEEYDKAMQELLGRQQETVKQARERLAKVCEQLSRLGATQVVIDYDGYNDNGAVDGVAAMQGETELELPAEIESELRDIAFDLLPAGWETGDGAYGELFLDVASRKIRCEHRWRIVQHDEEEYEL